MREWCDVNGFTLRPADDGDLNFIRKSYMLAYAKSHWARTMGQASYIAEQWRVRDKLLARCALLVAGRESEPTAICGWACTEGNGIHFVFVKERWQRQGVAKMLLAPWLEREAVCSHRTDLCAELPIPKRWQFNLFRSFSEE